MADHSVPVARAYSAEDIHAIFPIVVPMDIAKIVSGYMSYGRIPTGVQFALKLPQISKYSIDQMYVFTNCLLVYYYTGVSVVIIFYAFGAADVLAAVDAPHWTPRRIYKKEYHIHAIDELYVYDIVGRNAVIAVEWNEEITAMLITDTVTTLQCKPITCTADILSFPKKYMCPIGDMNYLIYDGIDSCILINMDTLLVNTAVYYNHLRIHDECMFATIDGKVYRTCPFNDRREEMQSDCALAHSHIILEGSRELLQRPHLTIQDAILYSAEKKSIAPAASAATPAAASTTTTTTPNIILDMLPFYGGYILLSRILSDRKAKRADDFMFVNVFGQESTKVANTLPLLTQVGVSNGIYYMRVQGAYDELVTWKYD